MTRHDLGSMVLLTCLASSLVACGGTSPSDEDDSARLAAGGESALGLEELALRAISDDPQLAEPAIAALRAAGPRGHQALVARHGWTLEVLRQSPPSTLDPSHERLRHAMDVVSGQRDGHASGLYWYTDLGEAEREARARGVPILSLRLLGRLDEEMSCANSRYFRLVLYPNRALSSYLREHYVLHWSSERPVPRITIDMGDGRRLERTITGNSIHYVLDADGRVIDALPGLAGPQEMLSFVTAAAEAYGDEDDREGRIAAYLAREQQTVGSALEAARAMFPAIATPRPGGARLPSALEAMPLTVSKVRVEAPMLDALRAPGVDPVDRGPIDWTRVGLEAYGLETSTIFDDTSRALLRLKTGRDDASSAETIEALSRTVVGDTARNRATFRLVVLSWLTSARGDGELRPSLEVLNERVYREMFLTPASDPWLGLQDPTVWDAIERIH
ncbi:MAG: hypothetical protein K1X94_23195 [Sandaracinaceae bacterium]|nr:hypothetical protein [Sandaracinaceae bacterium]